MNDVVMSNNERALWLKIGHEMGLKVDELGHPYREGQVYELEGQPYHQLHDFNPLSDPADAFRVQLHFNLSMETEQDVVIVRDGYGPILLIQTIEDKSPEGRVLAACEAICGAAGRLMARRAAKLSAGAEG